MVGNKQFSQWRKFTSRFPQGLNLQTVIQTIEDQNNGMNSKVTESADNARLPGTVKRACHKAHLKYLVALSDYKIKIIFGKCNVVCVRKHNPIHAYFRNKIIFSRDLKLQYLQTPPAQHHSSQKYELLGKEQITTQKISLHQCKNQNVYILNSLGLVFLFQKDHTKEQSG